MRKVLLTVLTVSSLLAFNACKKDGATGPAGPAGPAGATGAAGPAGAVGAAGAKGADGTKILSGTVDPTTEGVVGDFYFNKTTRTLWGPKVAAGWAGTSTTLTGTNGATGATGANGATGATGAAGSTGATGANGTRFLSGAGAPSATNPSNAATGDFYFDTTTSTFYGPRLADGTWASSMPLGSAYAAKTFNITKGFEGVTGTKDYGVDLYATYSDYNQNTSYAVTANDLIRIAQYPTFVGADGITRGGWAENREMVFETNANTNVFDDVATSAAQLGASTQEIATLGAAANLVGNANKRVGARFRYSKNVVNPLATFTLTQDDIDRLKVNNGNAWGYLTYGNVRSNSYGLGQTLVIADMKNVQAKTSSVNFRGTYTARTVLDLNNIPGLTSAIEKYKQDGKVFLKYRYYGVGANKDLLVNHPGTSAGWADITYYANSYAVAAATNTGAHTTAGVSNVNPFGLNVQGSTNGVFTGPANHPAGTAVLGTIGNTLTLAADQTATAFNLTSGPAALRTQNNDGYMVINWNISSGTGIASQATYIGPDQIQNAGNVADPVTVATANPFGPAPTSASYITRTTWLNYYSTSPSIVNPTLTATNNAGGNLTIQAGDFINIPSFKGGQPESYFTNTKLVKVQVFVIPGDVVSNLKAKGVDVNNLNEVSKHVKL